MPNGPTYTPQPTVHQQPTAPQMQKNRKKPSSHSTQSSNNNMTSTAASRTTIDDFRSELVRMLIGGKIACERLQQSICLPDVYISDKEWLVYIFRGSS
jgi:hypothetical protein